MRSMEMYIAAWVLVLGLLRVFTGWSVLFVCLPVCSPVRLSLLEWGGPVATADAEILLNAPHGGPLLRRLFCVCVCLFVLFMLLMVMMVLTFSSYMESSRGQQKRAGDLRGRTTSIETRVNRSHIYSYMLHKDRPSSVHEQTGGAATFCSSTESTAYLCLLMDQ